MKLKKTKMAQMTIEQMGLTFIGERFLNGENISDNYLENLKDKLYDMPIIYIDEETGRTYACEFDNQDILRVWQEVEFNVRDHNNVSK